MREDGFVLNNKFISYCQIESLLYNFPNVHEAVVSPSLTEKSVLKIYVSPMKKLTTLEKQSFCEEIESYICNTLKLSIPVKILIRDKLPITKTGKVLRSLLA